MLFISESGRNRWIYLVLVLVVIIVGLASRKYASYLPLWLNSYLGDTLWALMVFLICGFIFCHQSTTRVAVYALIFAYGIEISQLYHAPWIDEIRRTRLGGLVLGYGFLWRDILSYSIGIVFGALIERKMLFRRFKAIK